MSTERGRRSPHPLLLFPTLSRQPSAFRGGMGQAEQNNLGSTSTPEKDGKYNWATIQVMRNQLGKGQGDPPTHTSRRGASSITWTRALRLTVKPENLAFSWTPRPGWQSGDAFSPAALGMPDHRGWVAAQERKTKRKGRVLGAFEAWPQQHKWGGPDALLSCCG